MKFEQNGSRASEEKLFENVNGRTDRRKVITIAHPEHSLGELKIKFIIYSICANYCTYPHQRSVKQFPSV